MECGTGAPCATARASSKAARSRARVSRVIRHGQAGAGPHHVFAVGLQQGGIHAIQRGAAHQADDFLDRRSFVLLPACFDLQQSLYHACRAQLPVRIPAHLRGARGLLRLFGAGRNWTRCSRKERVTAYIGFDCTAKSMHIGNLVQLMTLRRLQQAGHKPDPADGRRHHQGGRSQRQGRDPADPDARTDRGEQAEHAERRAPSAEVRRRAVRRDHGRQCRMAGQAGIYPLPARGRPALLGQPHADHGQRQAQAGPRAADVLPGIQLLHHAGL